MGKARRATGRSRWSVSFLISVAAHAVVFALLAGSAIVRLDLVPETIDLAFLDVSDRTAGPGERAPEMRAAPAPEGDAPPVAVLTPPPPPVEPEPEPEPAPRKAEPAPKEPEPEPVTKPAPPRPREPVASRASPRASDQPAPPAAAVPSGRPNGTSSATAAGTGGDAATQSAPSWAPTARVRYEQVLFAWMNRHKQYPMLAQRRRIEGSGSVRVRIDRDGRVLQRAVVESTGEQILDQAALDMVRRASPFPAVPPEYSGDFFEFVAPIQYRLR